MGKTTATEVNKPVGSLVIVVFDGQSKNLIFRGIASHSVSKSIDKIRPHRYRRISLE